MIKEINTGNLDALCRGSYFFGSGGGGSGKYLKATVEEALSQWGPVPLISVHELDDDDLVAPIGLAGSPEPFVRVEAFNQHQIKPVLELAIQDIKKPIKALMPIEIGGVNALTPFCIAGAVGLPVLDADLKGRALPEISMNSMNIHGKIPHRAYVGNPSNGEVAILHCSSFGDLEKQGRAYAQRSSRSTCVFIPSILEGREVKRLGVAGTINRSISIGNLEKLENLIQAVQGKVHFQGKVMEYSVEVKNGFLLGTLLIQTTTGEIIKIEVKNEFLHLTDANNNVIAEAPDIISLLRVDDFRSVLSDQINVGDEVICVTCRGPEIWYSDLGMTLLRPHEEIPATPISASF